jgi:menaquinone-dependent protoporphyrinogen oxidase
MRTLIIYASYEGHADRIARRISECVFERGMPSDLVNVAEQRADRIVFDAYDAVVIGSPVDKGHYDSAIRACIQRNLAFLSEVPTAFFSVRLVDVGRDDEDWGEDCGTADEFLDRLRWEPLTKVSFAGAFCYSRCRRLKDKLMCWLLKGSDWETDLDGDRYTDWDAVDEFAAKFAEVVDCCKQPEFHRPTFSFPIHPRREYSVQNRIASRRG